MFATRVIVPFVVTGVAAQAPDIYDRKPTTVLGCECSSACTTSVLFECDDMPFCEVKSKDCAKGTAPSSVSHGYYDWCVYEPDTNYEKLTAKEKQDIVLKHVVADREPSTYPSLAGVFLGIVGESVVTSFNASADVFPEARTKYIHTVGVTAGISWASTGDHPYGGLFKDGADFGIIRLSSAKAPDSSGITPGMGVKLFRDGRPSANFVAMYSLDGQPCADKDFFAHDWHNHIALTDNFGLKLIAKKFWQASYCPLQVGLSDMASDADGAAVAVGSFPFELSFHALVTVDCDCTDYSSCMTNLEKLPAGTKLFEVSAIAKPGAEATVIGHITLTSRLTTSKFGDEQLFFKHQLMEEDFAIEPAWLDAIDRPQQCGMGCTGLQAPPVSKGCQSPFNNTQYLGMLASDAELVV